MPNISSWISIIALMVSLASLGLSIYVFRANSQFLLAKTRSDLLTKIAEARTQYKELNRRYYSIAAGTKRLTTQNIEMLVEYKEFENNTDRIYKEVQTGQFSPAELEERRHSIEGMLLAIADDMRRIDEWEKEQGSVTPKQP
jgi:uncharacterized coiled-coil DUF342 family protein